MGRGKKGIPLGFAIVYPQSDEENDNYELECESFPSLEDHSCITTGVEHKVNAFHSECKRRLTENPCLAIPQLYRTVRSEFSKSFENNNDKIVFLACIKKLETFQGTLYEIRRKQIPPAPFKQHQLDVNSDWFLYNGVDSIVIGDHIGGHWLRTILLSTDDCLKLLSMAQEIHGDGTFSVS